MFNFILIRTGYNIADVQFIKYDSEKQQIKIEPIPALMIKVYMKTGKWYTLSRSPTEMLSHSSGIKRTDSSEVQNLNHTLPLFGAVLNPCLRSHSCNVSITSLDEQKNFMNCTTNGESKNSLINLSPNFI